MTDLDELLVMVKSATGPDREIDGLVEVEARRHEAYRVGLNDVQRAYWQTTPDGMVYDNATRYYAPKHSESIDAALALTERVLPGWAWSIHKIEGAPSRAPTKDCEADLWVPAVKDADIVWDGPRRFRSDGATPPLALLSATLQALIGAKE